MNLLSSGAPNSPSSGSTPVAAPASSSYYPFSFNFLTSNQNNNNPLILQAPQPQDILYFNETTASLSPAAAADSTGTNGATKPRPIVKKPNNFLLKRKKFVRFPEDEKIIKDYSEAPKRGWMPGKHSTNDLLDAYIRSCDRHRSKPLAKLMQQLKVLQDLDCANGEKVNVLNLKSNKFLLTARVDK
jgi:hypothetical protein